MTLCVLMATYNDEKYIAAALDSILSQTYGDFELLVINDGSSDGTEGILREYARKDGRVRVVLCDKNTGLASALNLGLRETGADLVARMDADDVALPDRLEKQMEYLAAHPEIDVLGTFCEDIDEFGDRTGRIRRMPLGSEKNAALVWTNPVIHPTIMFRRDRIMRLGGYNATLRRRQDYDLWFRVIAAGMKIDNIPEVLLLYRETADTYRKNGVRAMWDQANIGLKGCRKVSAKPLAYLGVLFPLLTSLMPLTWRRAAKRALTTVDPRGR
jgi:glycosyltransferase involved in cell wall biosynthesis